MNKGLSAKERLKQIQDTMHQAATRGKHLPLEHAAHKVEPDPIQKKELKLTFTPRRPKRDKTPYIAM